MGRRLIWCAMDFGRGHGCLLALSLLYCQTSGLSSYGTQDISIGFTFGEFSRSAESWRIGTTLPWGSRDIKLTMTWGFQGERHMGALVGGVQRLALRSWQTLMYPKDASQ